MNKAQRLIKLYPEWTLPKEPMGRPLTEDERKKMFNHFQNFSWTVNIDARGHIVLGNGEDEGGRCYIDKEDLQLL